MTDYANKHSRFKHHHLLFRASAVNFPVLILPHLIQIAVLARWLHLTCGDTLAAEPFQVLCILLVDSHVTISKASFIGPRCPLLLPFVPRHYQSLLIPWQIVRPVVLLHQVAICLYL